MNKLRFIKGFLIVVSCFILGLLISIFSNSNVESPEKEISNTLDVVIETIENGDVGGLMGLTSEDFVASGVINVQDQSYLQATAMLMLNRFKPVHLVMISPVTEVVSMTSANTSLKVLASSQKNGILNANVREFSVDITWEKQGNKWKMKEARIL